MLFIQQIHIIDVLLKFGVHQFIQVTRNHISAGLLMYGAMQIILVLFTVLTSPPGQSRKHSVAGKWNAVCGVRRTNRTAKCFFFKSSVENISAVKMST